MKNYPYFDTAKNEYSRDLLPYHTTIPHVQQGEYIGLEMRDGSVPRLVNVRPLVLGEDMAKIKIIDDVFFYPIVELQKNRPVYLGVVSLVDIYRVTQTYLKELDAVIENSYDGIYISTPEGVNLRANKAIERLTGIKKEFFVGKSLENLLSMGVFNDIVTLKVAETKKTYSTIQRVNTGRETLVTGSPVFNESGELFRVITNVRDVSELYQLKYEMESAEKEKTRLLNELKQANASIAKDNLIVQDATMIRIIKIISEISHLDVSVLITGESGVGKEVIADQIYKMSGRSKTGSFLKINCAAIPKELIESELFGYEEGAFTGAKRGGKIGLFEASNKGTLFLDEIGDLPLDMQAKLLRVLQDQEFHRIGGTKSIKTDSRIIAATNHNLKQLVEEGKFRKDLFFRLNVIPLEIPPLRERKKDIDVLAFYFLDKFNKKYDKNVSLPFDVLTLLKNFTWPGNVRELSNVIERYVVLGGGKEIVLDYVSSADYTKINIDNISDLRKEVDYFEQKIILDALHRERSSYKAAAKLGVSQSYIARRLKKYGMEQ
ncbi:sigma 54-interacting transcriptional regulator [Bacillus sp. MUM 13]|uniref:sigma-54 interaction domain-containing protein n=1 Tax=Bacillus sp. MUM 13 TaxID=1678001 RepID=UPI00111466F5|nr:sigma 54-interacting transcriptional regulator [Bacillus sp. MUM 13]